MIKNCTTCKYEPDWKLYSKKEGYGWDCNAGKCKYPLPPNNTPFIGFGPDSSKYKTPHGKYFVDITSDCKCYAWEAK